MKIMTSFKHSRAAIKRQGVRQTSRAGARVLSALLVSLLLAPVSAHSGPNGSKIVQTARIDRELSSAGASTEEDPARLVRLVGQRASLECQLSPPRDAPTARTGRRPARAPSGGGASRSQKPIWRDVIDEAWARSPAQIISSGGGSGVGETSTRKRHTTNNEPAELDEEEEAAGGRPAGQADSVELILWYHGNESSQQPVYSVDARARITTTSKNNPLIPVPPTHLGHKANSISSSSNYNGPASDADGRPVPVDSMNNAISAKHYALASLSSRIRLNISASEPSKAHLIIDRVQPSDAGQYKCRVDFKYARTRYQLSQLEVITPVTQVQIKATRRHGSNQWDSMAGHTDTGPLVGLMEANEDDSIRLECQAKNGWPNPRLALWRLDWTTIDGQPKVTRLSSSGQTDLQATNITTASNAIATGFQQQQKHSSSVYLINTGTALAASEVGQTKGLHHVRPDNGISSRNNTELHSGSDNNHWAAWMQVELDKLLATVLKAGHRRAVGSMAEAAGELALAVQGEPSREVGTFLAKNRAIAYVCGAGLDLGSQPATTKWLQEDDESAHRGDKLALIRPVFRSILVQTNTWPRSIRMFLVSRRASNSQQQQIDLSELQPGQELHLSLANGNLVAEQPQLQLACQVTGSLPEAQVEWKRRSDVKGSNERALFSENVDRETLALVLNGEANLKAVSNNNKGENVDPATTSKQWSLLRVHNISIDEHQAIISCTAFNEKLYQASYDPAGRRRTNVTTWVRLNISHVPLVSLQLALESSSSIGTVGVRLAVDEPTKRQHFIVGQNVSFVCLVNFSNPPLLEPIQWLFNNDTAPFDHNGHLVRILERKSLTVDGSERLIVQLKEESELEVKCKAKNALGQGLSNPMRIVIGRLAHCEQPTVAGTDDNNQPFDKDPSVHCPVISDKLSSSYHWRAGETIITSDSPTIALSKLNLTTNRDVNDGDEKDDDDDGDKDQEDKGSYKIACYAIDKFGTNSDRPCTIRLSASITGERRKAAARARHCAASLMQKNLVQKRQQQVENITQSSNSSLLSAEPRLLLSIECKEDGSKRRIAKDELFHFDLYNKRDTHFIKRLISYPRKLEQAGLSLMLDLGKDLEALPIDQLEDQHVVVMSVTDSKNRPKRANVTLMLNHANNLATEETDRSPFRTASLKGHDGIWWLVTSFICLGSLTILLFTVLVKCKSAANSSAAAAGRRRRDGQQRNEKREPQSKTQVGINYCHEQAIIETELEDKPRPTVYHNGDANGICINNNQNCALKHTKGNPFDILIMEPVDRACNGTVLANYHQEQQQQQQQQQQQHALLLIDSERQFNQEGSLLVNHCRPCEHEPPLGQMAGLAKGFVFGHIPTPSPIGRNFELNSQGELTMTDESSSFIHETEPAICFGATSTLNSEQIFHQPTVSLTSNRQQQVVACVECRRLVASNSGGGSSNRVQSMSSPSSSSQASIQINSPRPTRNQRQLVRFADCEPFEQD